METTLGQLRQLAHRLYENEKKSLFWVSKHGHRYAYFSPNTKLHPPGTDKYSNIEDQRFYNGELVLPLPKDGYPYTIEFTINPVVIG